MSYIIYLSFPFVYITLLSPAVVGTNKYRSIYTWYMVHSIWKICYFPSDMDHIVVLRHKLTYRLRPLSSGNIAVSNSSDQQMSIPITSLKHQFETLIYRLIKTYKNWYCVPKRPRSGNGAISVNIIGLTQVATPQPIPLMNLPAIIRSYFAQYAGFPSPQSSSGIWNGIA